MQPDVIVIGAGQVVPLRRSLVYLAVLAVLDQPMRIGQRVAMEEPPLFGRGDSLYAWNMRAWTHQEIEGFRSFWRDGMLRSPPVVFELP